MHKVFLSHAASDKALVNDLKAMIQLAIGLSPGEFFYSSDKSTGIPAGVNFVDHIRKEMDGSSFVVSMITPAFRESEFCLAELGAVWLAANAKDFYPLCTPDVNRADLKATLTGIQVERIDEASTLADLLQRLCTHFDRPYNAAACTDAVNAFLATLPARIAGLRGATKIPAEELAQANATAEKLGEQLIQIRDELQEAREQFERLKAAKTQEEIDELELSEEEGERLEQLLDRARTAVWALNRDVQRVIPFAVRGDGMPHPDKGSWEYREFEELIDKGFVYDGDDGRVYLNTEWPDNEHALDAVKLLQEYLRQLSEAGERRFRGTYGVPADLSQTAAFEKLF